MSKDLINLYRIMLNGGEILEHRSGLGHHILRLKVKDEYMERFLALNGLYFYSGSIVLGLHLCPSITKLV